MRDCIEGVRMPGSERAFADAQFGDPNESRALELDAELKLAATSKGNSTIRLRAAWRSFGRSGAI